MWHSTAIFLSIQSKAYKRTHCGQLLLLLGMAFATGTSQATPVPSAVVSDGVPDISSEVMATLQKYQNARSVSVIGWLDDGLLIATRFGDTSQLHHVASPLAMRRQLTFGSDRIGAASVPRIEAAPGFLYSKDIGGSEDYQLYLYELATGNSSALTEGESRNTNASWSPSGSMVSYTSIDRGSSDWNLRIATEGKPTVTVLQDEGVGWSLSGWKLDESAIIMRKFISTNECELYEYDFSSQIRRRLLPELPPTYFSGAAYSADGSSIYFLSNLSGEFRALHRLDLTTEVVTNVTAELDWDVQSFAMTRKRDLLAYVVNEGGYSRLSLMKVPSHDSVAGPRFGKGRISNLRFSHDGKRLAMSRSTSTSPWDAYVWDMDENEVERWTHSELGELSEDAFVEPEIVHFRSFDDREIPAVLFKASGESPTPVLIDIHGGPTSQYRPGFSPITQYWINELGLSVIGPNVRGSTGYGNTYANLDNEMLREDSVRDIGALLDWIETQPDLDSSRVVVYGGSYGGYMVLASMVHYSDRLSAGISVVGISNFVTFLESTRGYRRDLRRVEYGDERNPKMRAFLQKIAPLNNVDKIKKPVLIGQGLNDPRVPASESEQIVAALKANDVDVWYVLANDEGHGFRKKVNRDYWNQVVAAFLAKYLLDQ